MLFLVVVMVYILSVAVILLATTSSINTVITCRIVTGRAGLGIYITTIIFVFDILVDGIVYTGIFL